MDNTTRKRLQTALTLPPGYNTDLHDDFVNWVRPEGDPASWRSSSERVVRMVGRGRCLVLFTYPPKYRWRPGSDRPLLYLDEYRGLIEFHPHPIMAEAERASRAGSYVSWDKTIGEWLANHHAQTYTGRGWAERCAADITLLVGLWQRYYNVGLRGE